MKLFIRTEASTQVGMGHFMRCFAIAEVARTWNIKVTFLLDEVDDAVILRCREVGAQAQRVPTFGKELDVLGPLLEPDDWLLIDSYKAEANYMACLHNLAHLAVIDDLADLEHFDCDLLINPAMAAPRSSYEKKTSARLLLGARYALIRQEFLQVPRSEEERSAVTVMFGGSDPAGLTGLVARTLHDALPEFTVQVIAGPANRQAEALKALQSSLPRLMVHISPRDVAKVLQRSSLVLTAAGGSVAEIAAMGLPALSLVVYDNQKAALQACPYPVIDVRRGLPDDLATRVKVLLSNAADLEANGRAAQHIIDGAGALRVAEAMFRSHSLSASIAAGERR